MCVNIASGNGWWIIRRQVKLEPILTYCQLECQEHFMWNLGQTAGCKAILIEENSFGNSIYKTYFARLRNGFQMKLLKFLCSYVLTMWRREKGVFLHDLNFRYTWHIHDTVVPYILYQSLFSTYLIMVRKVSTTERIRYWRKNFFHCARLLSLSNTYHSSFCSWRRCRFDFATKPSTLVYQAYPRDTCVPRDSATSSIVKTLVFRKDQERRHSWQPCGIINTCLGFRSLFFLVHTHWDLNKMNGRLINQQWVT